MSGFQTESRTFEMEQPSHASRQGVWERRFLLGIHVLITEDPAGNSSLQLGADLPALKGSNTNTSRYEQLALNSEVKCALSHTPNIRFSNMEPSFPDCSCPAKDFAIGKETKLLWYLYLLCGHRGILEELHRAIEQDMAITCAHTEHYIGTNCWGMDQAISFLAEPEKAKMIEFNPIRPANVCLPAGTRFVISNCHFEATKAAFAMFNQRVMECRLAAQVISAKTHLEQTQEEVLRYKVIVETEKQRKALQAAAESEHIHSPIPVLTTHSPLQLTWPRSEPPSPGPPGQSCGLNYVNHLLYQYPALVPLLPADPCSRYQRDGHSLCHLCKTIQLATPDQQLHWSLRTYNEVVFGASYSLLLASRGSTNSRTPPASEFGWAVPLARTCVRPAGARATISTPSPIAVMLGGAMQEETTGMPNT
eukprot:Em0001g1858a